MTVETRPLDNIQSLPYFAPELVLVVAILLLIVWDLVSSPQRKTAGRKCPAGEKAAMSLFVRR